MVERGWGRVVNIASIAGLEGGRYIAHYSAAKHAVVGFTRSLALESPAPASPSTRCVPATSTPR